MTTVRRDMISLRRLGGTTVCSVAGHDAISRARVSSPIYSVVVSTGSTGVVDETQSGARILAAVRPTVRERRPRA